MALIETGTVFVTSYGLHTSYRVGDENSLTLPVLLMKEPSAVKASRMERLTTYDIKAGDIIDVK